MPRISWVQVYRETGSIAQHFASMWNYLDALSISFNVISIVIWCYMAYFAGNVFEIQLVEEYYQSKYWYAHQAQCLFCPRNHFVLMHTMAPWLNSFAIERPTRCFFEMYYHDIS